MIKGNDNDDLIKSTFESLKFNDEVDRERFYKIVKQNREIYQYARDWRKTKTRSYLDNGEELLKDISKKFPASEKDIEIINKDKEEDLQENKDLGSSDMDIIEHELYKKYERDINDFRSEGSFIDNLFNDEDILTEFITTFITRRLKFKSIIDDNKREVWIYHEGIYLPNGLTHIKAMVRALLQIRYTEYIANRVIDKTILHSLIEKDSFFGVMYENEVLVNNGILDLNTKELKPFTHEKYFNSKIPTNYNPTAKCDLWIKHLNAVLENPERDIPILQEFFGFCLLGSYRYEKCLMLVGNGNNGKSLTTNVLRNMLGVENTHGLSLKKILEDRFSASELFGKLVNIGADIGEEALSQTELFKNLTSNKDLVSCDRKNMTEIKFYNKAKLIFCCNVIPRSLDESEGFFRRWIVIDMPFQFVTEQEKKQYEEDKDLDTHLLKIKDSTIEDRLLLKSELEGVLNWAVEGLSRLKENNGSFSKARTSRETKKHWISKTESVRAFLNDCFKVTNNPNDTIEKKDFRVYYASYCRAKKLKNLGDQVIKKTMQTAGITEDKKSSRKLENDKVIYENIYFWEGLVFNKDTFEDIIKPKEEEDKKNKSLNQFVGGNK